MRVLNQEELEIVTETIEGFIEELVSDNDPDDADLIAVHHDVYAALVELMAWRQSYPNTEIRGRYVTDFGPQEMQ